MTLALAAVSAAVLLNNFALFGRMAERLGHGSLAELATFVTAPVLIGGMCFSLLALLGAPYALKPLAAAMLLLSAGCSYFSEAYGTVFDSEMFRNIFDAFRERNRPEMEQLLSWRLAAHVLLRGLLPAALVFWPKVSYAGGLGELKHRGRALGMTVLVAGVFLGGNFKYLAFIYRSNRDLRCYATPTFPAYSLAKLAFSGRRRGTFREIGTDARLAAPRPRRKIGVIVVGETARADHFSINGYERTTTPNLASRDLVNFPRAFASGTSTAVSLPGMFTFLSKREFSVPAAASQSNLLDVLARAGVRVVWLDNNSGPKGVCDRTGYEDLRATSPVDSPFRCADGLYDGVFVEELPRRIASQPGDVVFVLHMMGSHGPAYHLRFPPGFDRFTPYSRTGEPHSSPREEVVNAYDNSILYTDHVLGGLIDTLQQLPAGDAPFLLYASDHGESLGENGIYLHGLPLFLAPEAQTRVPMFAWISPALLSERRLDLAALRRRALEPSSHFNLPHTVLGLLKVETSLYRPELDLLRP